MSLVSNRRLGLALGVIALALSWESPALAYIDPTTSGTLMQILAPVLIALGVMRQRVVHALRLGAERIRRALGRDDRR